MKKKLVLVILSLLLTPCLNSCSSSHKTNSKLLISEVIEGTGNNRAVELYNMSDKEITLNDYSLGFYVGGSEEPTFKLELEGIILPKETFVIAHQEADDALKNHADIVSSKIMFIGSEQISLLKGNKIIDLVGNIGYQNSYNEDVTLVRKTNYFISRNKWEEYDWIRYSVDNFKYIGNIDNSVTPEEMEQGPRMNREYESLPFIDESNPELGGGGYTDVMLHSGVDGDTAKFLYPNVPIAHGTKVRFQNINTPESYAENVMPWGIPAKFWTTEQLEEAADIKIQSLKGGLLKENFERVLAWVWVDGELLNYKIVKNGYSEISFGSVDNMFYKDISYTNWLYDAQLYAKMKKKAIWGEKDPYWDYKNNESTYSEKFDI